MGLRLVLIAAVATVLTGVFSASGSAEEAGQMRPLNCAIKPLKIIDLAAPIPGVLAKVYVRPGQRVAAGELIAKLDVDLELAELEVARLRATAKGAERVAQARKQAAAVQLSGAKKAFQSRVMSKMEYERLQSDYRVADQEVTQAKEDQALSEANLARMKILVGKGEIRAPEAGVIGEEPLSAGEAVNDQAIAQIIVTNPLKVEVYADAAALEKIEAGLEFVLIAGALNRKVLPVTLDYIAPLADPKSKVVKAMYELSEGSVRPGEPCLFAPRTSARAIIDEMTAGSDG